MEPQRTANKASWQAFASGDASNAIIVMGDSNLLSYGVLYSTEYILVSRASPLETFVSVLYLSWKTWTRLYGDSVSRYVTRFRRI
jgi:hypothetical protein